VTVAQGVATDEVAGSNPPVIIDGTAIGGVTGPVLLTIKNAKPESGVELWYMGTTPTGYDLMNASGVLKGGLAIAAATNDWITGSAADDVVIHAGATKYVRIGAKGSSAARVAIDCGCFGTWSFGNGGIINDTSNAIQGGVTISASGVVKAYAGVWAPGGVLFVGTQGTGGRVTFTMNTTERMSLPLSGDVVIGDGNTAATVLATTATAGFLRLSTCAGTPTGAAVDGSIVIDTTGSKLWVRIGGTWKSTTLA
jgi:hypothetical protein